MESGVVDAQGALAQALHALQDSPHNDGSMQGTKAVAMQSIAWSLAGLLTLYEAAQRRPPPRDSDRLGFP